MAYIPYTISREHKERKMDKFTVEFYEKENGDIPVEEFLDGLNIRMKTKLVGLIKILQEKGNLLREPYSKPLGDGIFELRCKVGNDISRVLYFFYYNGKIIMTNGFVKKTRKTPRAVIDRAKAYRDDYLERNGKK
jgi:phage-related protein